MKTVVSLQKLADALMLQNLTPEIDMSEIKLTTPDINRPALQLIGYYEHFVKERVQIIGYVEYTYIMQLNDEERRFSYERFISSGIPCVIFTTLTEPSMDMLSIARKYGVPTLVTERTTCGSAGSAWSWLRAFRYMACWWMCTARACSSWERAGSERARLPLNS